MLKFLPHISSEIFSILIRSNPPENGLVEYNAQRNEVKSEMEGNNLMQKRRKEKSWNRMRNISGKIVSDKDSMAQSLNWTELAINNNMES